MPSNSNSNPYSFSIITALYISLAGHIVKNLDEIIEINCSGICFIKKTLEIVCSIDSLLNSIIIFLICFFVIQIRMERMFFKRIKQIYKDLEFKTNSVISTSSIVSDMNSLMQDVGKFAILKKAEIESLRNEDKFRKEFIGNVAHELKTPLFSIQGYISNLLDGAIDDKDLLEKYLKRAEKSVDRLSYILKDLDLITQIESSNLKLKINSFDIIPLINEIIDELEISASKKKIKILLNKYYENKVLVEADRNRIQQVLTNLITNSINYGAEKGTTEIIVKNDDDKILVKIIDNGLGISDEHMPRLFERFFRVDISRSRNHGGSGLGLAIVKHIIDAHGENIYVKSALGIGSEFSFTLKKSEINLK
ncbi:MAG: two-component sensor histidine kinase [Flammeovirgaceae bacterium]|nr:two-component sensor histidine kinase [Flammeovirgaceae bacterium]|tara:strand:- start:1080 stop:2174 length:1095 start_codon:yes stop_codon:yes gene_type:complete